MAGHLHEDLRREFATEGSSDRNFGLWFALIFAVLGLWPLRTGGSARIWALGGSVLFLLAALVAPSVLHLLNTAWTRFGLILARVINPVATALIFFLAVTPIALILRWMGKDVLRLKAKTEDASYWLSRTPPGPTGESMRNQF
jgi:hypothetical protein